MPLTEAEFAKIVDAGCPDCPRGKLAIESLVVQKLPLLEGEPYGTPSWGYKGEDFVHGAFRIACTECKKELFTSSECPRCNAAGGVERALSTENALPLARACAKCGSEQLTATAIVPATVIYESKRAGKARAQAGPEEAGFHALRVECKRCHDAVEVKIPCALCGGA